MLEAGEVNNSPDEGFFCEAFASEAEGQILAMSLVSG